MKRKLRLAGFACLFTSFTYAQGIIVNEISQGPAGAQEFIELLVVGSATQTSGTVDLRDWIIDDNNGEFLLSDNSAPGIAIGHFRFAPNDTFAAVPIGALLVIYNVADPNPAWTFRQLVSGQDVAHIENSGFTYYIPGNSTLLRACAGTPNNTSTSYAYSSSTIPPLAANWTGAIGLANNGDAIQTRKPDGTFFHGFGFSTPTIANSFTTFPSFSEVSLSSFNGYTGVAANTVTYFDCGSYYYSNNFLSGTATSETPGAPNTVSNDSLINNIRAGFFQYSQLGNNVLCSQILPVQLLYFTGQLTYAGVVLQWATASELNNKHFRIQRSTDQKSWQTIGTLPGNGNSTVKKEYVFTDNAPLAGTSFYRLEQTDQDDSKTYSTVVAITNQHLQAQVYPNPVKGNTCYIHTANTPEHIALYDMLGRQTNDFAIKGMTTGTVSLDLSKLSKGIYYLKLYEHNKVTTLPLVKE
jgi:hypothetical protein